MKVCRECGLEKELTEFYVHKMMGDGYLNKCKECVKSRVNTHRSNNLEKAIEYDRKRNMLPHRVAARKQYMETESGKKARIERNKRYAERFPIRAFARHSVGNAVRDKRLVKAKFCSECGSDNKIEGHHDDYTKPLEVRWLCEQCHKKWHKTNKPIYE